MVDTLGAPPPTTVAIKAARAKLNAPPPPRSVWPVLGAAALAAASALAFATAIIVGPPAAMREAPPVSSRGG